MKTNKATIILLGAMIGILAVMGCHHTSQNSHEIKIGVIIPLTGDLASYGTPLKQGIDMALGELNSRTNPPYHYSLSYVDSKADPSTAVSGLLKLINVDNIKFVIGDVSSSTTLAMVPVAERSKVFLLAPGASSPTLHNISPFFARDYPSSVQESIETAKFIIDSLKQKKVCLIYANDDYGLGLAEMFKKEFGELGGTLSFEGNWQVGQADFRTLIAKLKDQNPSLIYLAGDQKEMGKFMRQYGESGLHATIVSDISFLEPDCLNVAGSAANGVIVPVSYYNPQDSSMQGAYKFGQMYYKKYSTYPSVAVAVGYDALMLIAHAIETGHTNPQDAAAYIRNLKNYDGASGKLSFTDGDVSAPIVFKIVENGKPVNYH